MNTLQPAIQAAPLEVKSKIPETKNYLALL
jgi:hypothetical protein